MIERPRLLLLDEVIELERRDRLVYFKETSEERDERRIEVSLAPNIYMNIFLL